MDPPEINKRRTFSDPINLLKCSNKLSTLLTFAEMWIPLTILHVAFRFHSCSYLTDTASVTFSALNSIILPFEMIFANVFQCFVKLAHFGTAQNLSNKSLFFEFVIYWVIRFIECWQKQCSIFIRKYSEREFELLLAWNSNRKWTLQAGDDELFFEKNKNTNIFNLFRLFAVLGFVLIWFKVSHFDFEAVTNFQN